MPLFLKFCLKMLCGALAFYAAIALLVVVAAYAPWLLGVALAAWCLVPEWEDYKSKHNRSVWVEPHGSHTVTTTIEVK